MFRLFTGLYRLCGSATKKRILREAFERNPRTIDLSPDNVPDINVITGENISTKKIIELVAIFFLHSTVFFRRFQRLLERVTRTVVYEAFVSNDRRRFERLYV